MPRLCANLSMLFGEVEFFDRFRLAAQAGFRAVECQFPYAFPKDEIAQALKAYRLRQIMFNLPAGDWESGDRGLGAVVGREAEFRAGVHAAVDYALALDCRMVNCLAGIVTAGAETARSTFIGNLRYAARLLKDNGITLLIEPINNFDVPGFWLSNVALAKDIIAETAEDNVAIQYDIYHQQRSAGELIGTFALYRNSIAHIQIADNPGRHEPGTGEINFPAILAALDQLGYNGYIGCEYKPSQATCDSLVWARLYL